MNYEIQQCEEMYHGRAFDVQRLSLRLPDGRVRPFDLVRHNPSITVIPVTADGHILFVRQYRMGVEGLLLELPAGVLEKDEDPTQGARRELREETGMDALELKEIGAAYLAAGYCDEFMHFFLARGLNPAPLDPDEDEFLTLEAFTIQQTFAMARRGEIPDAKTLAALFLVEPYLL